MTAHRAEYVDVAAGLKPTSWLSGALRRWTGGAPAQGPGLGRRRNCWVLDLGRNRPLAGVRVVPLVPEPALALRRLLAGADAMRAERERAVRNARSAVVEVAEDGGRWTKVDGRRVPTDGGIELLFEPRLVRFVRVRIPGRLRIGTPAISALVEARHAALRQPARILCSRTDGFGERLNAMVNGFALAEALGVEVRFTWSTRFAGDPSHAIEPLEAVFSPAFIEKHLLRDTPGVARELAGRGMSLRGLELELLTVESLVAPRLELSAILSARTMEALRPDTAAAFGRIGFSDRIRRAIEVARSVPLAKNPVALHLRSGDVFYGRYRKRVRYTYKGVTLPIAKAMIRRAQADGATVYLFGQDREVLRYLSDTLGANILDREGLAAAGCSSPAQEAIHDLVLMSRFPTIMGGSSGFAVQASRIGGSRVVHPADLMDQAEQLRESLEDLEANASRYHPLQTAFAYWYAYFCGRRKRSYAEALHLLDKAAAYDRENELYPLAAAALAYGAGDDAGAAARLDRLFGPDAPPETAASALAVYTGRTLGRYNMDEFHPHVAAAAGRGVPEAMLLDWHLSRHGGNAAANPFAAEGQHAHLHRIADRILGQGIGSDE